MSDESKTEFQLWAETEFINGPLQYHGMYLGWHARDAEVAALKARVEELEKQLTVTDDRDRTHSAECWKWHRHHACAIGRVEVLEGMLAQRNEILDKLLPRYNADDQEKPKADSAEIRAIMRELQDRESWMSDESRKSWK